MGIQTLEMDNQGYWTEVSGLCIPSIVVCAWELMFLQLKVLLLPGDELWG